MRDVRRAQVDAFLHPDGPVITQVVKGKRGSEVDEIVAAGRELLHALRAPCRSGKNRSSSGPLQLQDRQQGRPWRSGSTAVAAVTELLPPWKEPAHKTAVAQMFQTIERANAIYLDDAEACGADRNSSMAVRKLQTEKMLQSLSVPERQVHFPQICSQNSLADNSRHSVNVAIVNTVAGLHDNPKAPPRQRAPCASKSDAVAGTNSHAIAPSMDNLLPVSPSLCDGRAQRCRRQPDSVGVPKEDWWQVESRQVRKHFKSQGVSCTVKVSSPEILSGSPRVIAPRVFIRKLLSASRFSLRMCKRDWSSRETNRD